MSIQLLKSLNGNKPGELKNFIDKFEGIREPRICWYPSAGTDFRALMFLHSSYEVINPATKEAPVQPDIFLFTDYYPWEFSKFLDSKVIYSDGRTNVWVNTIEELPSINTSLHSAILHFPKGSKATNKVIFLNIDIDSDTLGKISFPVVYVFSENESFCAEKLLPNNAMISHIIHVRYGGGCGGGGNASGAWLLNVLKKLQCEVFISDDHLNWQEGDKEAVALYPSLDNNITKPKFEIIRKVKSETWSAHGDVNWNLVK